MKPVARRYGITVSTDKGKAEVTLRGKSIAKGEHYKDDTFTMNIEGKPVVFKKATDIIDYMVKHKMHETVTNTADLISEQIRKGY